ncbi:MAG: glutamate--cysteine ligase [Alphaproteobacteria bacterium]
MSAPPSGKSTPIESRDDLVYALEKGNKPKDAWRIGTEHEKFGFSLKDYRPIAFHEEANDQGGVSDLLNALADNYGWTRLHEGDNLIALTKDGANITLEPGGQFELSGAPLENLHQTCNEVHTHLHEVKTVAEPMNIGMLGLGYQPLWTREETPWMPKGRYKIMGAYMEKKGNLGLDMMKASTTIQVNLDFSSEADMVKKLRVSLALQPIATAIFANSPFTQGKLNGYQSFRAAIWHDTDPDRTGGMDFAFEDGMGFERYVDYALDVPMYFIYRDGDYLDATGQSFRAFMDRKMPLAPGEMPMKTDWDDHLTTLFPDVRLKSFLEMRGADGGPWRNICGLPALWVGLLYDDSVLDAAWDLVKDWSQEDRNGLALNRPKDGLRGSVAGRPVLDVARQVADLANEGLKARAKQGRESSDETEYLEPVLEWLEAGQSPADRLIAKYNDEWAGDIRRIFEEEAY